MLAFTPTTHQTFKENPEGTWFEPGIKTQSGLQMINYFEGEVALYLKKDDRVVDQAFEVTGHVLSEFKTLSKAFQFKWVKW